MTWMCAALPATIWSLAILARGTPRPGGGRIALAGVAGVVASYSFTSGFLVWPLGVLLLLSLRSTRAALIWVGLGALTIGVHLVDLQSAGGSSPVGDALANPAGMVRYVCGFLGASIFGPGLRDAALAAGFLGHVALLVAAAAVLLVPANRTSRNSFALILGVYAVGCAWMCAVGRLERGEEQAFSDRYPCHSAMLWIALIVLGMRASAHLAGRGYVRFARALTIVSLSPAVVLLATQPVGWQHAVSHHEFLVAARTALLDGENLSRSMLSRIAPDPSCLPDILDELEERRLSLYRDCAERQRERSRDVAGSTLSLHATTEQGAGQKWLVVRITGGRPGNMATINLTRIGGNVVAHAVWGDNLDESGRAELRLPIADEWRGAQLGFRGDAVNRFARLEMTREVLVEP